MKIAVTHENGNIFQHFGHTEEFKVYTVNGKNIEKTEVVTTNGQGHGALAELLQALQVDVLICGGIGGGAQMALAAAGIALCGGVSGNCDEAVQAYLQGTLHDDPNVRCNHHEEHHGASHQCGSHACDSHSCKEHDCH